MRQMLIYGLILGLLLAAIEYFHYKLLLIQHAESLYTGIVAAICAAVGIWAGIKISAKFSPPKFSSQPATAMPDGNKSISVSGMNPALSQREMEVLQLIANGMTNQEIADALFLSLNTVKTHTANLFSKLDVQRRTQAIQKAKMLGIIA